MQHCWNLTSLVSHLSKGSPQAARNCLLIPFPPRSICLLILTAAFLGEDIALQVELDMLEVAKVITSNNLASVEPGGDKGE